MDEVRLTPREFWEGVRIGVDRYMRNRSAGRPNSYGAHHDAWEIHAQGALGELAVSKLTGIPWDGGPLEPDKGAPDVGPFHVRTTQRPNGRLLLHKDDSEGPYILVVQAPAPNVFTIAGWILASDGKRPEYWETFTGRPCYFVPRTVLRPFSEYAVTV